MDNARKDIKRRIAGPLDGFDAEVKALIARIVDARAALDTQVKDFERRDREGRRAAVQFTVDNIKSCEGVPELDIPINPSWLNKSTRQAEILEDIKRIIAALDPHRRRPAVCGGNGYAPAACFVGTAGSREP